MNEPLHNPSQAMSSLICFDPAQGPPKQARPLTGQGEHPTLTSPCVRADSTGIVNMENLKFKICTNEKFTTSSYKNSSKPPQDQNGFLLCLSVRVLPTKFLAQLSTYPLLSSFTATARPPARSRPSSSTARWNGSEAALSLRAFVRDLCECVYPRALVR